MSCNCLSTKCKSSVYCKDCHCIDKLGYNNNCTVDNWPDSYSITIENLINNITSDLLPGFLMPGGIRINGTFNPSIYEGTFILNKYTFNASVGGEIPYSNQYNKILYKSTLLDTGIPAFNIYTQAYPTTICKIHNYFIQLVLKINTTPALNNGLNSTDLTYTYNSVYRYGMNIPMNLSAVLTIYFITQNTNDSFNSYLCSINLPSYIEASNIRGGYTEGYYTSQVGYEVPIIVKITPDNSFSLALYSPSPWILFPTTLTAVPL